MQVINCRYMYLYIFIWCLQVYYTDLKTTDTTDLELHQLKNVNEASVTQHSACRTNRYTTPKSCSPRPPPNVLQCQHCDYTTAYSGDLKAHSRKHTGDMLRCQQCDYVTTRLDCLKKHSRKHTVEMLKCWHCDYTTTRSGDLKVHFHMHTDRLTDND